MSSHEKEIEESAIVIAQSFMKNIKFGYFDYFPLFFMANKHPGSTLPGYSRNEELDALISFIIWTLITLSAMMVYPILFFPILFLITGRTLRFRYLFVKTLRAHQDKARIMASEWCNNPNNRKTEMEEVLAFSKNERQSTDQIIDGFFQLFYDINQRMRLESRKDAKENMENDYKKAFCRKQ